MKMKRALQKIDIKKYLLLFGLILLSILFLIKTSKIILFLSLTLISGIIVFVNYYIQLPFDISPVFFLSIIITSTYSFGYTVLFVFLAGFIPSIFSEKGLSPDSFMYLGVNLLINLISLFLSGMNIVTMGIILSILYSLLVALSSTIMEGDVGKEIFSMVLTIIMNVLYFSKLGVFLITILG